MNGASTSDADLMMRIARGDRAAFSALIERHQHYIHKLAYRFVGRWDVADDLTQDALLRVYRAAATYKATAAFSTWLYRLILNLAHDWRKSQTRRSHAPLDERSAAPARPGCETESPDLADTVQAAIHSLPDNQRDAVILHRFCRLPHREIAEIMEKSESAVESYLTRAYANLRSSLSGRAQTEIGPQEFGGDVV